MLHHDSELDLALLELPEPLAGHPPPWLDAGARGDTVAVVGSGCDPREPRIKEPCPLQKWFVLDAEFPPGASPPRIRGH